MAQSTERFIEYAEAWLKAIDRKKAARAAQIVADNETRLAALVMETAVSHIRDCLDREMTVRATTIGDMVVMISRLKGAERSSITVQTCEKE